MSKVEKSQNKMSNRDSIEITVYPEITYSYEEYKDSQDEVLHSEIQCASLTR